MPTIYRKYYGNQVQISEHWGNGKRSLSVSTLEYGEQIKCGLTLLNAFCSFFNNMT
jgi:hypothetical protein